MSLERSIITTAASWKKWLEDQRMMLASRHNDPKLSYGLSQLGLLTKPLNFPFAICFTWIGTEHGPYLVFHTVVATDFPHVREMVDRIRELEIALSDIQQIIKHKISEI